MKFRFRLAAIALATCLIFFFNNCIQTGFDSKGIYSSSSEFSTDNPNFGIPDTGTSVELELYDKGVALYSSKNCTQCHGPSIETSQKRGVSLSRLLAAIGPNSNISQMNNISLSEVEANALVFALNNDRPKVETPIPDIVNDGTNSETVSDSLPKVNANIFNRCSAENNTLRGSSNHSLRKLDKLELLNSVKRVFYDPQVLKKYVLDKNLFFQSIEDRDPLQVAINEYPADYSDHPGEEFQRAFSSNQLMSWFDVVDQLASLAKENQLYQPFLENGCNVNSPTQICFKTFLEKFGFRVFRRPMKSEELTNYLQMHSLDDPIHAATKRFLMSPDFLFLVQEGQNTSSSYVALTQYEIASKTSYMLSANMPDDELLKAAQANQLSDSNILKNHIRRLLKNESSKERALDFINSWVNIFDLTDDINSLHANFARIPNAANTGYTGNQVGAALRQEAKDFVNYILWTSKGSYNDLLTKKLSFPPNERVAKIYGVVNSNGGPVVTPNHPGILTRGAFLATLNSETRPIKRGVTVMESVLCEHIPSPDFSVIDTREESLQSQDSVTIPNFERVTHTTSASSCMSCHAKINAYGFVFEEYSPIGNKWDSQFAVIPYFKSHLYGLTAPPVAERDEGVYTWAPFEHPLPGAQSLEIDENVSRSIASTEQLVNEIAQSTRGPACFATRMFRYYNRRAEDVTDSCTISEMVTQIKQGKPLEEILIQLIAEESNQRRKMQ